MITRSGNGASSPDVLFTAPVDGFYWVKCVTFLDTATGTPSPPASRRFRLDSSDTFGVVGSSQVFGHSHNVGDAPIQYQDAASVQMKRGCTLSFLTIENGTVTDSPWTVDLSVHICSGQDLAVE